LTVYTFQLAKNTSDTQNKMMHLLQLLQVTSVLAQPADRPHLPNLFLSVDGPVDNYTSNIVGTVPKWLKATKFNNGFGKFEGDSGFEFKYLFDVMSYVSKWRVDGESNSVTFANQLIESDYLNESAKKIPPFRTFAGTQPGPPISEFPSILTHMLSDNLNVNMQMINGRLFAISDMAGHMEIDPLTLKTMGMLQFKDKLNSKFSVITCAHPTQLANEPFAYNYYVKVTGGLGPSHAKDLNEWILYRMNTVNVGGPIEREAIMKLPLADHTVPYMHSFANTPNYLVLFQFPLHWDIAGIMFSETILKEMKWEPKNGTRILVVDKKSGKVLQQHYTKAAFAYHHVNAFENDTHINVDITLVPCDTSELDDDYALSEVDGEGKPIKAACLHMNAFNLATIRNNSWPIPPNSFERFAVPLPPKDGAPALTESEELVPWQKLTPTSFDLATMHPDKRGSPYRYLWGLMTHGKGTWWSSLVKLDLQTGSQIEWYKPDHLASEPNFIPTPGATKEDDGVLISQVLGGPMNRSYLLMLNATTMEEIATADAPHFLPFASHGFTIVDHA